MASFAVTVIRLDDVKLHPNADRLEIAQIGGYQSIVPKGVYKPGDLAVYVPEGAILPDWLLEQQGLVGKLAGAAKNRVKAIKLRKVLSQGLVIRTLNNIGTFGPVKGSDKFEQVPVHHVVEVGLPDTHEHDFIDVIEGQDVADILGITKFEPVIPVAMRGELKNLHGIPLGYDIENIKRYPNVLTSDVVVVLTEKLHGTCCQIGWRRDLEPDQELFGDGRVYVCSKGLGKQGLVFKNNEANANNLYVRTMRSVGLLDYLPQVAEHHGASAITVFGEVFGDVQDLKYGMVGKGQVAFRCFDVKVDDNFATPEELEFWCHALKLDMVPVVVLGPWREIKHELDLYTRGKSLLAPDQIREGVVIRPYDNATDEEVGRVIFKSVSEDYLLRNDAEATEFA